MGGGEDLQVRGDVQDEGGALEGVVGTLLGSLITFLTERVTPLLYLPRRPVQELFGGMCE